MSIFAFFHSTHDLHQLKKRSSPPGQSGYECEISQYINEYVTSCVRVASCRPGAFCVLMGLLRVMLARSHSPVPLPAAFVSVTRQPTTETEVNMAIINLRDYYPFYTSDCFMEVSEEVAEMFKEFDRKEAAYRLRTYRHKAYYSLDRDDGLEHEAVFVALSPHELYERKVTMQELHAAISSLPDKQAKRIYAHFILGMTKQDIARAEGVHEKVVRVAIERGLRRLEKILKNSL